MLQRVLRSRLLFGPPIALAVTVRQPNEDVYVYRLRGTPGEMRRVFFRYVEAINDLYAHPRFYNTVTTNQLRDGRAVQPADESGRRAVDVEDPAQRLRAAVRLRHGPARHVAAISGARHRANVNARAHAADGNPRFAERIREGLPVPRSR
jgi:hypothetical protein